MEMELLTDADGSGVSKGKFGVQDSSGNFFGEFDTQFEAEQFIKDEVEGQKLLTACTEFKSK